MRGPLLDNLDQALIAIWAIVGLPTIVIGWLHGILLPPIWSSGLLIEQLVTATFALLVYGIPAIIAVRIVARALR
jgi:hypothetical protein